MHTLRIAGGARQTCPTPAVEAHALEDAILSLPVQVVRRRDRVPITLVLFVLLERHGEAVDFRESDRLPEKRIGDTEYGRVGADAQRQRQRRDYCEAWTLPQHPQRVAKVLQESG